MSDVLMPQMGESVAEGTIVRWMKRVGDAVDKDEPLFEISTDKVDAEIPSPAAGVIKEIRVTEGETVPVHTVVAVIDGADAQPHVSSPSPAPARKAEPAASVVAANGAPAAAPRPEPAPAVAPQQRTAGRTSVGFVSPVVRRMAEVHDIDLTQVQGTGAGGRITKKDVDGFLAAGSKPAATTAARALYKPGDNVRVEKMSIMRQKIADHMVTSLKTSAHIYSACEVDFSRV